ncbi:MAG: iron-containing alcohol dehydrogenase [Nevskiaceae bacterium]|nr:MAG: iron-containing alcohol dehydrogenase [Nevskiaceae bacterium]TBR72008.1 MAG: iron-containing alcohol dehydrogenase [Nevskiaceae bacterium]
MGCCHVYEFAEGCESAFTVDASRITFGHGCLREAGARAGQLGMRRVAFFADPHIVDTPLFQTVTDALHAEKIDVVPYTDIHVEPTDASFKAAIAAARDIHPDGFISLGGGSTIDTCKAANLYTAQPAEFLDYVNAPIGGGRKVAGALKPHIACPTTSGTGSEVTGVAVFDLLSLKAKTGIASPRLRPSEALIDPDCTRSLPSQVVACSGLDVLSHALESYTARPYTRRPAPATALDRPGYQGANPWSDLGCREALRLLGAYLQRAVDDATDTEAREQVMWAATLAGIAFGNSGVHAPHGMAYAVAGLVRDFHPASYPQAEPMVPHGMSVIVNAPSVFRYTAETSPQRHLDAAGWLGADVRDAAADDAGEALAQQLIRIMRGVRIPNGLSGVGYGTADVDALTAGAYPQQRLLQNAPREMSKPVLAELFRGALRYW